jgi:hypothetical protein
MRSHLATLIVLTALTGLGTGAVDAQAPIDVYELADYRLTSETFDRFVHASARIADIMLRDASFAEAPLFTKDVALSGDAVAEAAGLMARIEHHAGLAAAIGEAKLTPREYVKFAITLVAARLAYGFLKSGVLPRVASGAPTINVEFVRTRETDVVTALASLGIRD